MKKEMDIMEKVEVKNLNAGKYVVLKLSESWNYLLPHYLSVGLITS